MRDAETPGEDFELFFGTRANELGPRADEDEEGEAYGDEHWHGEHESHPIPSYNII